MVRPAKEMSGVYGPVIFTTHPAPRGFMNKYILGLTPIFLTALSLLVLNIMLETGKSFPHSLAGPWGQLFRILEIFVQMFAYLIAPVCIFVFFIFIGDVMNRPGNMDRSSPCFNAECNWRTGIYGNFDTHQPVTCLTCSNRSHT